MKTSFSQVIPPHCRATARAITEEEITSCVGDMSFLDYGGIKKKRQGNGGNGLLLHSALAVDPEQGQPLGLLWQKVWNRQHRPQLQKRTPFDKRRNVGQRREKRLGTEHWSKRNPVVGSKRCKP